MRALEEQVACCRSGLDDRESAQLERADLAFASLTSISSLLSQSPGDAITCAEVSAILDVHAGFFKGVVTT